MHVCAIMYMYLCGKLDLENRIQTKQHTYYCCSHTGRIKQSIREGHTLLRNALHVHNNLSDKRNGHVSSPLLSYHITSHLSCHSTISLRQQLLHHTEHVHMYKHMYCFFLLSHFLFPVTPYQYTCTNTASFSYNTFQFHYALLHVTIYVPPQVHMYNSHHNQMCALVVANLAM